MPEAREHEAAPPGEGGRSRPVHRVELLGSARLVLPGGELRLERRPAALLAYLALEGPTPRGRLAGLLWPDGDDTRARANLRQLVKRMRAAAGVELVSGDPALALVPGLTVDAARLERLAFEGRRAEALAFEGTLLAGLEYDDCPEFEDWLIGVREGLDARRRDAAAAESERLEHEGEFGPALEYARRRVQLEPLSEEAHRRVMRLHYLLGDRGAALAAYEHLKIVLRDELGAEPLPETAALAREIERGAGVKPAAAPKPSLPLAALRPPVLAGRAAAWAAMEAAWEGRQFIFVSGEPGSGKSRLALDFAASKGFVTTFSARPGDAAVPYAAAARTARRALAQRPGLELELPGWVRRELARLLPEFGEAGPPLEGEAGRLRLYDAYAEFFRLAHPGGGCHVSDDFQFADQASVELGAYALVRAFESGVGTVVAFRSGELPPSSAETVCALVAAGALHLELPPLGETEVGEVLASLGVPGLDALAAQIARHTGGNPQFVLETVRHLVETGQLERGVPARLPPSGRVRELTARRLERLSPAARDLARAAAALGPDLTLGRAALVLEARPFDLAPAWAELEAAQVLREGAFSHDLVLEAVLATTPAPLRPPLAAAAATALEATGGEPSRVAEHWLAAGEERRAVPGLLEAGRLARAAYRLGEAAVFLERAAGLLEAGGERPAAFAALDEAVGLRLQGDFGEGALAAVAHLLALADAGTERARAHRRRADLLGSRGDGEGAEAAARAGLAALGEDDEPAARLELLDALGMALWRQGRPTEGVPPLEEARRLAEALGDEERLATALDHLATVLDHLDRLGESVAHLRRAARLGRDRSRRAERLVSLGTALATVGRAREGLEPLEEAVSLLSSVAGAVDAERHALAQLGTARVQVGEYAAGLENLTAALRLSEAHDLPRAFAHAMLARALLPLGAYEEADAHLEKALTAPKLRRPLEARCLITRGRLLAARGEPGPAAAVLRGAAALVAPEERWRGTVLRTAQAAVALPEAALGLAETALATARDLEAPGLAIGAATQAASALLALGRPAEAAECAAEAAGLLGNHAPVDFYPCEVLLVHFRALAAVGHPQAAVALEGAARWVLETADAKVPPERRESFLGRNPTNRAILALRAALP